MSHVFIFTYQRVNRQQTWRNLPKSIQEITQLVVHPNEVSAHADQGRNVLACPVQGHGCAAVRQWILDYCQRKGIKKFVVCDDDMAFQIRQKDFRIVNSNEKQTEDGFKWLFNSLDHAVHAAFCARGLLYLKPGDYTECVRAMQALAYNVPEVRKAKVGFAKDVPAWFPMDDFHMTLQLLEKGLPNRVSLKYRYNPSPSNIPGGCSEHRDAAMQTKAAKLLHKLHPKSVKLREKKAWNGMEGETMMDVAIYWKRAYKLR